MGEGIEMSPFQKNIWNMCIAMKDTAIGVSGGYFYSETLTDYTIWEKVMLALFQSTAALRIQIHADATLYLKEYEEYVLPIEDLSHLEEEEAVEEIERWMHVPLESIDAPLFDCRYVKQKKGICMFGRFHHVITDGVSYTLMLKRQEQYYLEYWRTGQITPIEDRAFWEELCKKSWKDYDVNGARNWYRKQMPGDRVRSGILKYNGHGAADVIREQVPQSVAALVKENVKKLHVSTEAILFAAVSVVLRKLSGEESLTLGRIVLNRERKQLRQMGLYVNTQPVFSELSDNAFFGEVCEGCKKTLFEQLKYTAYAFDDWKQDFHICEALDCVIAYRNTRFLVNMDYAKPIQLFSRYLEIPLRLCWDEERDAMHAELQYAVQGWTQKEAGYFLNYIYQVLFQGFSQCRIRDIRLRNTEDAITEKHGKHLEYQSPVAEQAIRQLYGQRTQSILKDCERAFTGQQCLDAIYSYTKAFLSERLQTGELIGIEMRKRAELPLVMLAAMLAGGAFVQISVEDDLERKKGLYVHCKTLADERWLGNVPMRRCGETEYRRLIGCAKRIQKEHRAYAVTTSGTTGKPKIVTICHEALNCRLVWMKEQFGCGESYLQKTKRTFDVSVWELLLPFISGGSLYILPDGKETDCQYLEQILRNERISIVHFVPTALDVFLKYVKLKKWTFPQLHYLIASGEALTEGLAAQCREQLPNVELFNLYGPAECTIDVSCFHYNGDKGEVPIGKAVYGTGIYIVNQKTEEVPNGAEGEICVTGTLVGDGYLAGTASEEQQRKFTLFQGEKAYLTGDIGRYGEDGSVYYVGRKDSEIKIRGMRVNLAEIAQAGTAIQGITSCHVQKEGEKLTAYYTGDAEISEGVLKREFRKRLPYYSIPNRFRYLHTFPIGAHGKTDVKKLAETGREESEKTSAARNPSAKERRIQELLKSYLGETADVDKSIFEAGLTSIDAARFILDLEQMGIDISFQDLYEYQTIASLAADHKKENKVSLSFGEKSYGSPILLCFPYATGGAESFQKLAEGLRDSKIEVRCVNLNEYCQESYDSIAEQLWTEIPKNRKVHALGYCVGTVAALAFLKKGEETGRRAESFWICGALPYKPITIFGKDYMIWDFVNAKAGKRLLEHAYGGRLSFPAERYELFKSMVRKSQIYYRVFEAELRLPTVFLYGDRDLFTICARKNCRKYRKVLTGPVHFYLLKKENHYFVNHRGEWIAELFLKLFPEQEE